MDIQINYDSSVNNAPAWYKSAVQYVCSFYDGLIANNTTLTVDFGWGEENNNAVKAGCLAQNQSNGIYMSYTNLVAAMTATGTSAADKTAIANLLKTDPTNGAHFYVPTALAKALGAAGSTTVPDGYVGLDSSRTFTFNPGGSIAPGSYDVVSVLEHELSEILGRIGWEGQASDNGLYTAADLFRYSAPGQKSFTVGSASFSIDGQTMLGQFNNALHGGDSLDWSPGTRADTFGNTTAGVASQFSTADYTLLDVLGYTLTPQATISSTVTYTDPGTAVVTGTVSDPASHVELYSDGTDLGSATVAANGSWALRTALPAGYQGSLSALVTASNGLTATVAAPTLLLGSDGASAATQCAAVQNSNGTTSYTYAGGSLADAGESTDTKVFGPKGGLLQEVVTMADGSHTVTGQKGHLTLTALGDDTMTGGGGSTSFVFQEEPGQATVTNFIARGAHHDVVSLSRGDFSSIAEVLHAMHTVNGDTVISFGDNQSITLQNVTAATLRANPGDFRLHA